MSAADLVSVRAVVLPVVGGHKVWEVGGRVHVFKLPKKSRTKAERWVVQDWAGKRSRLVAEKRAAFVLADEWAREEAG